MILFNGKIFSDDRLDSILARLPEHCTCTLENRIPLYQAVIHACSTLSEQIQRGTYHSIIQPLLDRGVFTKHQLYQAVSFFQKEHIETKYQTELGCLTGQLTSIMLPSGITIQRSYVPLGILLHIAAGNAEGLPFYSVIEGLLAGNINILKLPSMDDGLSLLLLQQIIQIEPCLAPYITVFDISSTHTAILKKLEQLSDAIVVWGGDEAVRAARTLASPSTHIISWGHKLSFAYLTLDAKEEELRGLAAHICETNQLLCSSCQGIFVDTENRSIIQSIGHSFLKLLEEESTSYPPLSIGIRGKTSISLYNEELESETSHREILKGKGASIILSYHAVPELSYMFRNCWIKPLPRTNIVSALKPSKGYLQTVGLLCSESDRLSLSDKLIKAGVVRITYGSDMSRTIPGEAHDGKYALRRYCKVAEIEI